jgi:hypothetical protein
MGSLCSTLLYLRPKVPCRHLRKAIHATKGHTVSISYYTYMFSIIPETLGDYMSISS